MDISLLSIFAALAAVSLALILVKAWSTSRRLGATPKPAAQATAMPSLPQPELAALRAEIADLRATVAALDVRLQTVRQRQEHQVQELLRSGAVAAHAPSLAMDDLIALARQGWSAAKLVSVAHISRGEAELLQRLHAPERSESA